LGFFISLGNAGKVASETHSMWMDSDDPDFVPSSADENDDFNPCKKLNFRTIKFYILNFRL
jgi:hypothetical protein